MNRRSMTISFSGVIILIVTVIITTLYVDDWPMLTIGAFIMLLLTEILFFGGLILVERIAERSEQIITRSTLYTLLSAYLVVNVPVSILYMAFLKEASTSFMIIEVVLLAILAIGIVVSLTASKGIHQANEITMSNVSNMEALVGRLNKLATMSECEAYAATLKKLSDDLRFTDFSVNVMEDEEIADSISALEIEISNENISEEAIKGALVKINSLISQRKLTASTMKKGKI